MKPINLYILSVLIVLTVSAFSCNKRPGKARVLVFTKTAGFFHESIPTGVAAIQKLGAEHDFLVDTTSNADWFTDDSLTNYSAVIFLSTTGDLLNHYQEAAFERYIQAGGGYVGVHGAADAEYDWRWYGRLVGGYFESHPEQQDAILRKTDVSHEAVKHLPEEWKRWDEWYNFKHVNPDTRVILTIDESSYKGGTQGDHHPMAWFHEYDGGRAFYTALGHTNESYSDSLFLEHLLGGIRYAIGDNKILDYAKAKTANAPEEARFSKEQLVEGTFSEPTEMTILPNLDILVAQRRGELMLYKSDGGKVSQVGFLDVYHQSGVEGVNAEEGLMGIAADPNFKDNQYIYMYYSPADTSVNRLSRFVFRNDQLDKGSEKVILEFYSQRGICCHTGGSIAFGEDNELYLSVGDNSTPFDQPDQPYVNRGFAPLDDRPGFEQYDALRAPGNTNDLRGKILRILIQEDGTYTIPEGNLFSPGQEGTRPEIYVMGNRNPYRISIDSRTGYLYWGEVGPDAANDSLQTRGPRGYDEINQARKAGNFGWPMFIANNLPYHQYDYTTGKTGAPFNPEKPLNQSRNNTGLKELPPAQPAFIWYPYGESPDFPQVGAGGRTAMAGPVYYAEDYPESTRYPDYYNGKLFIYEWIRGWIKVVTMQPNGDFEKMEPFMAGTKFNAPMDMEVGPDGMIYVLEYGNGWFAKNKDAGLARIRYNGGEIQKPAATSQAAANQPEGKAIMLTLDCQACHKENERSIGPAYVEIAQKYRNQSGAPAYLAGKIIKGSVGVWGENAMPAHPSLKEEDAIKISEWIMTLGDLAGHQQ
jgi:cytochrome c